MTAFHYIAVDGSGNKQQGVIEGDHARQVRQQLRANGLLPVEVGVVQVRAKTLGNRGKLKAAELSLLTRQMATLVGAGLPLDEVLSALADQVEKVHVKSIVLGVRAKVCEGFSLAKAMASFPKAFPLLYRTTIASGESSGQLDDILLKLADYTEKQQRIKRKVQQALIYPAMMTVVSLLIVVFLLLYVVPKIVDVFSQTQQALPLPTVLLLNVSHFMSAYGLILLGVFVLLGFVLHRAMRYESVQLRWNAFVLRLPLVANLIKTINVARFARTLGILHAATVPILNAMEAAAMLITPLPMRYAVQQAVVHVREGGAIAAALKSTGYFSAMVVHLVASGEKSGQLSTMLTKVADAQDEAVEAVIQNALTLFEPLLILLMGCVVLFIVLAVMLPIFDLNQIAGQA